MQADMQAGLVAMIIGTLQAAEGIHHLADLYELTCFRHKKGASWRIEKLLQYDDFCFSLLYTPWAGKIYGLPREKFLPAQGKIFLQAGRLSGLLWTAFTIGHKS